MPGEPCHPGNWPPAAIPPRLLASARAALGAIFAGSVMVFALARHHLHLESAVALAASLLLAAIFALAVHGLPRHHHARFGYANSVTAIRAALTSLACAIVIFAESFSRSALLAWVIIALAAIALALDGIDGYLARRYGQESPFGARFDMEMDALLILVLSVAAIMLGKAGLWALAIGLMRYAFVAAQALMPRLRGELVPSFRRKLICVVQVAVLVAILVPAIRPLCSDILAALSLLALAYSFAIDILHLVGQRQPARV